MRIGFLCQPGADNFAQPFLGALQRVSTLERLLVNPPNDETLLEEFCKRQDVVLCEWGTSLAFLLSRRRRSCKIAIRLYAWEIDSPWMEKIYWENINFCLFVSAEKERKFKEKVSKEIRSFVLPVAIDLDSLKFFPRRKFKKRLLMVNVLTTSNKQIERAIQIFDALTRVSSDWKLKIKSPRFVRKFGKQIQAEQPLHNILKEESQKRVNFEFDDSPLTWERIFQKKDLIELFYNNDIILSLSKHEGNHTVIAEAMATGMFPIIRPWEGSREIYGNFVMEDGDIVPQILRWSSLPDEEKISTSRNCRSFVEKKFSPSKIANDFIKILQEV
jgi:glycosyltransferase involved in cell wall biosynthesis